jgi:hypothetical protein
MSLSENLADAAIGGGLRKGWPDRFLGIFQGHPAVMEIKSEKDKLSTAQVEMRDLLVASGFRYYEMRVYKDETFEIWLHSRTGERPCPCWDLLEMGVDIDPAYLKFDRFYDLSSEKEIGCNLRVVPKFKSSEPPWPNEEAAK